VFLGAHAGERCLPLAVAALAALHRLGGGGPPSIVPESPRLLQVGSPELRHGAADRPAATAPLTEPGQWGQRGGGGRGDAPPIARPGPHGRRGRPGARVACTCRGVSEAARRARAPGRGSRSVAATPQLMRRPAPGRRWPPAASAPRDGRRTAGVQALERAAWRHPAPQRWLRRPGRRFGGGASPGPANAVAQAAGTHRPPPDGRPGGAWAARVRPAACTGAERRGTGRRMGHRTVQRPRWSWQRGPTPQPGRWAPAVGPPVAPPASPQCGRGA
jgi:hypothetical protein